MLQGDWDVESKLQAFTLQKLNVPVGIRSSSTSCSHCASIVLIVAVLVVGWGHIGQLLPEKNAISTEKLRCLRMRWKEVTSSNE